MYKLGLTGSIGMGKTTTATMFRDEGCPVFDADAVVHRLYEKGGEAVPLIKAVFPDVIEQGAVNRKKLSVHMKADPLNLQVLESFIHPMVAYARQKFIQKAKEDGQHIVVFDIPLLFEIGADKEMDGVAVVTAPDHIQQKRVLARPNMTKELFEHLKSRQMADDEKRKRADFLIFTDQGLDFARKQVQSILQEIKTNL